MSNTENVMTVVSPFGATVVTHSTGLVRLAAADRSLVMLSSVYWSLSPHLGFSLGWVARATHTPPADSPMVVLWNLVELSTRTLLTPSLSR